MYEKYDSIGKRLTVLMQESGMTQTEVAHRLKEYGVTVSMGHVNKVKLDKGNPSIKLLIGFAKVFGTTSDFILCLSDKRTKVSYPKAPQSEL